jgi:hypothetical protein
MMKRVSLLLVLWSGRSLAKDFSHADEAPQCNDQRKMVQVSSPQKLDKVGKTTPTGTWIFKLQEAAAGVQYPQLHIKATGCSLSKDANSNEARCDAEGVFIERNGDDMKLHSPSECKDDEDCEVGVESYTKESWDTKKHAGAPLWMKQPDGTEKVFEPSADEPIHLVLSLKTGEVKLLSPPPLVWLDDSPSEKLEKCEGDCDEDAECQHGLKCFHRHGYTLVPGCSGLGKKNTDYCFDEENSNLPVLKPIVEGSWGEKLPAGHQLDLCEGDCDMDSECKEGYVCFQRDDEEPVPGCSGKGERERDYCSEPVLTDLGHEPVTEEGLGQCQGDCDEDEDCKGDLKCFKRHGLVSVPGCRGSGAIDYDYCVNQ